MVRAAQLSSCLVVALLGSACLLLVLRAARAHAADSLRVVVRVASAGDRQLLARIRGQLSDVSVELSVVETAALEPAFSAQVEAAHALAESQHAQAVLWFAARSDAAQEILVHVATPHEDRILTRRLRGDGKSASADSGLLEAAALVVRTAVSALASGGAIGVATREAIASAEHGGAPDGAADGGEDTRAVARPLPSSAAAAAPPSPPTPQPTAASELGDDTAPSADAWISPEQAARAADLHVQLFAGFQSLLDGASQYGQRAFGGRLSLVSGGLVIGAYGSAALDSTIPDRFVALHVARHALGGTLDGVVDLGAHLRFGLGAHAGALWFTRSSEPKAANVQVTRPAILHALAFGPEASLTWAPGPIGFGLQLALDVLPNAPSFDLGVQNGEPARHTLWSLQPRASVGLEARLP